MGCFGVFVFVLLFMIIGWSSWGVVLVVLVWGLWFVLYCGEECVMSCVIFVFIVLVFGVVYVVILVLNDSWIYSFGLGGLFGDIILGVVLMILLVGVVFGFKLMLFLMGLGVLVLMLFVMGFMKLELFFVGWFLMVGVIMIYVNLMILFGCGVFGVVFVV